MNEIKSMRTSTTYFTTPLGHCNVRRKNTQSHADRCIN